MIHDNPYIVLICGVSGSGKSETIRRLKERYGYSAVQSYTTRPKRFDGEDGHIFITDEEVKKINNICAKTIFDNYFYAATEEQINRADIYAVDPNGIKSFLDLYKGDKKPIIVRLYLDGSIAEQRMVFRGDDPKNIKKRIANDLIMFAEIDEIITRAECPCLYYDSGKYSAEEIAEEVNKEVVRRIKRRNNVPEQI